MVEPLTAITAGANIANLLESRSAQSQLAGISQQYLDEMLQLQELMLDAALAGYTDPEGNRYYYDRDKQEWVQDLTPIAQQRVDLSSQGELLDTQAKLDTQRYEVPRAFRDRGARAAASDSFLDEVTSGYNPYDDDTLYADLLDAALEGIDDSYRDVTRQYSMQAARTGSTGANDALGELARERFDAGQRAARDARIQSTTAGSQLRDTYTNNKINQYLGLRPESPSGFVPSSDKTEAAGIANNQRAQVVPAAYASGSLLGQGFDAMLRNPRSPGIASGILGQLAPFFAGEDKPSGAEDRRQAGNKF